MTVDGSGDPAPDGGGDYLPQHGAEAWDGPGGMWEEWRGDLTSCTAAELTYKGLTGGAYGAKGANY